MTLAQLGAEPELEGTADGGEELIEFADPLSEL